MKNIITREQINKNIIIHQDDLTFDYTDFCGFIDFWKIILVEKYQATAGKTCYLNCLYLDIHWCALFFAAAELGIIILSDSPVNKANHIHNTNNPFKKIDYFITANPTEYRENYNNSNLANYIIGHDEYYSYKIKNTTLYQNISNLVLCNECMPITMDYSTAPGELVHISTSHKKASIVAKNIIKNLNLGSNDSFLHTRVNYPIFSIIFTVFLPAFIAGNKQFLVNDHYRLTDNDTVVEDYNILSNFVHRNNITHVLIPTPNKILDYLTVSPAVMHSLNIITYFQITEPIINLMIEKNIKSIKGSFGDRTIGQCIFFKEVLPSTDINTYDVSAVGQHPTDIYDVKIQNEVLYIAIPEIGQEWKTSNDMFELVNQNYCFRGRKQLLRFDGIWFDQQSIEQLVSDFFTEQVKLNFDHTNFKIQITTNCLDSDKEKFLSLVDAQFSGLSTHVNFLNK
jgi:hypothetical protein